MGEKKTYNLSVIVPSIRPGNLKRLYESIGESYTNGNFEMICIGPYELPMSLRDKENVKQIIDHGSPTRAQQIGLINCTGRIASYAADDGFFIPNAINIGMKTLESNPNSVIVGTYNEGAENEDMAKIDYYYIATHESTKCKYLPKDCLMLMTPLIPMDILKEVGGFDASVFESLPCAFNDLSVRLYNKKVNFIFQPERLFKCGHMPGEQGDHGPIHRSQTTRDMPRFKIIYSRADSVNRINIPLDNWQKAPAKWKERFGE